MAVEGFDSIVDRLMACEGYDRDEAEMVALIEIAAEELKAGPTPCPCGDPDDCDQCGLCL